MQDRVQQGWFLVRALFLVSFVTEASLTGGCELSFFPASGSQPWLYIGITRGVFIKL